MLGRRDGDFLRSMASTMVVMTHCLHLWVRDFYARQELLSPGIIAAVLDQLSRFTVPAFFLLSGYALTRQQMSAQLPLTEFYRKRMPRILAPFFLWSAITSFRHWGFFGRLPWREDFGAALARFSEFLFLRGFDYQYYFLIVIFQFYLLFPLLYRLARHRWFLVLTLLPQLALMSPAEAYYRAAGWQLPSLYSYWLAFFLFYCVAGMHAALNPAWLSGLLASLTRRQAWGLWLGAFALVNAEFYVNMAVLGKQLAHADHFNRWVVALYCAASFILLLKHRDVLKAKVHDAPHWQWFFTWVTPFSFFVYLAHTHVLRLADLFLKGLEPWRMPARVVFVLAGSYALAWTAQRLLRNAPKVRFALGLPHKE